MTQQALLSRLNWLQDNYGPVKVKTAEAYFHNLTNDPAEVLSEKFVKLAELQGMDPWELAFGIARAYPEIEKTAAFGWPMSQYYLQWAEDIEKDAFVQAARNLLAGGYRAVQKGVQAVGGAIGKRSAGAVGQAGDVAATRAAGNIEKSLAAQEGRAFEAQSQKLLKQNQTAQRQAQKDLAKAQKTQMQHLTPEERIAFREQQAAKMAPPAAAPAAAPAPPPAAAPAAATGTPAAAGAPAAGTPTTGAAATPGKTNWGHVALGTGAVAGTAALGYGGYRLARGPSQGGAVYQGG